MRPGVGMARFIRALAKVGLVELDEDEAEASAKGSAGGDDIEALLAETRALLGNEGADGSAGEDAGASGGEATSEATSEATAPAAAPAVELPPLTIEGLTDDRPLPTIYEEAGVPESPYAAEQLLKVIEGLAALEPAVRRTAVEAMDAADDTWTIADPLLDAKRKVAALQAAKARLDSALSDAEAQSKADIEAQDQYAEQASATIREQIAELEATLASELQGVAEQKSQIRARLEAARSARGSQVVRLDDEIERLRSLYSVFGDPEREQ